MKRMLAAVAVVLVLAQCGTVSNIPGSAYVAQFFPTITLTASRTATITLTPTVTLTPSITPTPTCEQLARIWAQTVFMPGVKEFEVIHTTTSTDAWFEHYNEFVRIAENSPPPKCAPVLGRAHEALRRAVMNNRLIENYTLQGKDTTSAEYGWLVLIDYPEAVKSLNDYVEIVQKQYKP